MDSLELIKKVRKIEIKTRGLSQNIFAGEYHTAFKGRGMTFSEKSGNTSMAMTYGILTGMLLRGKTILM